MKTKRIKTLLSLLLVLAMSLSLCGVSVFADDEEIDKFVEVIASDDNLIVNVGNTPAAEGGPIEVDKTTSTVTITEDIHTPQDVGLSVTTQDSDATVTVVAENVESDWAAVNINNANGGAVEVNLGGDDHGSDSEEPAVKGPDSGIVISNTGGTVKTEVDGDVEAGRETITVSNSESGTTTVKVDGDVKADMTVNPQKKPLGEHAEYNAIDVLNDSGKVEIVIEGNVESDQTGVLVNGTGKTDVEIDETLSVDAGGTPVLIGQNVSDENLTITVWKVEVDGKQAEEGSIVKISDGGIPKNPDDVTEDDAKRAAAVEKSINYIIKIDPQQKGSSLSSDKDTAKASETVKVTVKIPDGHTLKAVYTDEGQTLTAQDNGDGTFTLTVPVGGGVYVHADFAEIPASSGSSGHSDSGTGNAFLTVKNGTASYNLGKGDMKITLLAQTLKTLVKSRGLTEFVFTMNGKVYTVKAEDLLAWLASSPSVTLYADGDRLVLDFGNGEIVVLASDEAIAAVQEEAQKMVGGVIGAYQEQAAAINNTYNEKTQAASDSYNQSASRLSKQLTESGLDKETVELMQQAISEDKTAFEDYTKERTDAVNEFGQQVGEIAQQAATLAGMVMLEKDPQAAAEEQKIVNDLFDQAKDVISGSGENLNQQIDDVSAGNDSALNEEQSVEQAGGDEVNEEQVSVVDAQKVKKVQEQRKAYISSFNEAFKQIDEAAKERLISTRNNAIGLLNQLQLTMNDQVSENQTQQNVNDQATDNQTQDGTEQLEKNNQAALNQVDEVDAEQLEKNNQAAFTQADEDDTEQLEKNILAALNELRDNGKEEGLDEDADSFNEIMKTRTESEVQDLLKEKDRGLSKTDKVSGEDIVKSEKSVKIKPESKPADDSGKGISVGSGGTVVSAGKITKVTDADGDKDTSASNTSATNYTSAPDASKDYSFSFSGSAKPISVADDNLTNSDSPYSGYYKDDSQSSINLPYDVDFGANNSLFQSGQTYGTGKFTAGTQKAQLANEVSGKTVEFSEKFALGSHDLTVEGALVK